LRRVGKGDGLFLEEKKEKRRIGRVEVGGGYLVKEEVS
jgi:hypothetical protein